MPVAGRVIAVTGATGELGGRVAARLARRGAPLRLVVRDPGRAPAIDGAEVVEAAGYADSAGMRRAFEGARTVFLVSAGETPDRVDQHRRAVGAAVAAGVERVVYASFLGAAPDATFTFARDHFHTEQHIRSTALRWTVLRNSLYLDFIPLLVSGGTIRGPAGSGRVAAVARDDIADVAGAVLAGEGEDHVGQTYDLTGAEAITMAEAACLLSEARGEAVTYEEESLEEARASRARSGAPAWEIEGWVTSYLAIATGELDVVSDTVERLTGHPPIGPDEYLRKHPHG